MKPLSIAVSIVGLVAALGPVPARAQTQADDLGSQLRFRQLADGATLPKGRIDFGVQFSTAPVDTSSWDVTRFFARFGTGNRVDIGVWGGYNSHMRDGMAGMDVKIALLKQGPSMPVSVAVRPSFSSSLGASDVWAASTAVDLSVSRAFGAYSPYAGFAAASSLATEHPLRLNVDRDTAGQTLVYAGLSYTWRSIVAAVEVERGTKVSYAFRFGTRF